MCVFLFYFVQHFERSRFEYVRASLCLPISGIFRNISNKVNEMKRNPSKTKSNRCMCFSRFGLLFIICAFLSIIQSQSRAASHQSLVNSDISVLNLFLIFPLWFLFKHSATKKKLNSNRCYNRHTTNRPHECR